jgi:putative DNA methylase
MTVRKKLIEVALPLDAINKESAREKSIRYGHPGTLRLRWARRPAAWCVTCAGPSPTSRTSMPPA